MIGMKCPVCGNLQVEAVMSHRLGDEEEQVYECRPCSTMFGVLKNGRPVWWKPLVLPKSKAPLFVLAEIS